MNKFNALGMDIIEYKKQLLNETYPKIVRDSLTFTFDKLCEKLELEADINLFAKDNTITLEDFKLDLLNRVKYIKTKEELFKEYEVIKNTFLESINKTNSKSLNNVEIESKVENEEIFITKKFNIDREFVRQYFSFSEYDSSEQEKETLDKLMKRGGFIEVFSVLRLTKILSGFLDNYEFENKPFICDISETYYDEKDGEGFYSIDFILKLGITTLEEKAEDDEFVKEIIKILDEVSNYYFDRIIP